MVQSFLVKGQRGNGKGGGMVARPKEPLDQEHGQDEEEAEGTHSPKGMEIFGQKGQDKAGSEDDQRTGQIAGGESSERKEQDQEQLADGVNGCLPGGQGQVFRVISHFSVPLKK